MNDSTWTRPLSVLFAPEATFRAIAARPTWLVALLIIILISLAANYVTVDKIDFAEVTRAQMADSGQSAEQIEQAADMAGRFGKIGAYVAVLVGPWIVFPLMAAVFFVVLRLLGGSALGFGGSLAAITHGFMPQALRSALSIPIAMGRSEISNEDLEGGGLLPSNLNAFMGSADQSPMLTVLYQSVDFFHVWTAVLLTIAYRYVAGVSKGKAVAAVVGLWGFWIAIRLGWTALAQSFS